ncbi:MAG: DUF1444 family protein [Hamadaea sp.]|uniref:DUF1444 family protein n=1 Tax=Hamadaea sp. TaxID=2024425 RepID=UPI001823EC16|nr:DUF1444 family protein [Hamadaea sp.]NUR70090.1 DUF1444 family protein [Hamadaea sp.]NUT23418.1 DUF1444 family protein [Hamadaea sp.]
MGLLDRLVGSPRDRFAAAAVRIARRLPGVTRVRYDRGQFAVVVERPGRRTPARIDLAGVYAETRRVSRAARRRILTHFVRGVTAAPEVPETWEAARPRLRPVLRAATFGQAGSPGQQPPISRAALPHLRELVVVDLPESMVYVSVAHVERWGVTVEEIFRAAHDNLAVLADRTLRHEFEEGALIRMVDSGDGYFTSLLLSPGWLAEVSRRAGDRVVAFVPNYTNMVLCPVGTGAIGQLFDIVEQEYGDAANGLSPVGYVADDYGRVVPFAPGPDEPDHLPARRAEVILAVTQYAAQTAWLGSQYAQAGIEVFVSGLLADVRPESPAVTVATWSDGIAQLLPRAHYVLFQRSDEPGPLVPWDVVVERVGLEPEPLLAPARYRVDGWPPAEVMDELRAHSIG